ncbi:flagellar assembly protein FliH [Microbacterium sp. W4I4]|uniref:FliH/SctL family protein n=1 Tax=Microbacterium sp. W4I4 TaxID=3042295 RepID=UPI0027823715|nr:FliH/SctL family protein [Microbacterium sp. W4I4]MDQ0613720.1 flagellar assembly protein FliH [Microbacterium sp. W4I4]
MSTDAFAPAVYPRLRGADAESERRLARQRGYADGHAEGFRAAMAEAAETATRAEAERVDAQTIARLEVASAVSALDAAVDALRVRAEELTRLDEQRISARAIELAETILGEALADRELSATTALRRAVAAGGADPVAEVRMSTDDVRTLQRNDAVPAHVRVVADESLSAGESLAMLRHGFVDARIGQALDRARRVLDEVSS